MIVGSLLLILVAVTLLVTGLAAGSSVLLTSSIAASLLAALALVIGARQAAAGRAAPAGAPLAVDLDDDPGPAATSFEGAMSGGHASRRAAEESSGRVRSGRHGDDRHGEGWSAVAVADPGMDRSAAFADTEVLRDARLDDDPSDRNPTDRNATDYDIAEPPAPAGGAARITDPNAADDDGLSWNDDDDVDADRQPPADPARGDRGRPDGAGPGGDPIDRTADPAGGSLVDPAQAGHDDVLAHLAADDDEDPPDEPLPQRIQPSDAVRVSRMTADVLVVDGRPRYHLADCPHLDGRETEPVPVAEAVDLGFTPCGLCRPVDRLVAEAARR
jgi:clumping factor A